MESLRTDHALRVAVTWCALAGGALASAVETPSQPVAMLRLDLVDEEDRAATDALVLEMLEGEALYTLIGHIKPISTGIWSTRLDVDAPEVDAIERTRRRLAALRTDEFWADVVPYTHELDDGRYATAVVMHRPSVERVVRAHPRLFVKDGVTPASHALQVVLAADRLDRPDQDRVWGYLFGYPEHAVEFFVAAEIEQAETGAFVPRDFVRIPCFRPTASFVWAVAKDRETNDEERLMTERAAEILAEFRRRRAESIDEDGRGALVLLDTWLRERRSAEEVRGEEDD